MRKRIAVVVLLVLVLVFNGYQANSREKKSVTTSLALYKAISMQDSMLFAAYNSQDIGAVRAFLSPDIEWFQDNNGLLDYNMVVKNLEGLFSRDGKMRRTLMKGSLEIYRIKDYGAIETGIHRFEHMEDGRKITGTFKFLMIWQKTDDRWLLTKVVSYDH
jgi:ketosteroid isomerase-like protein